MLTLVQLYVHYIVDLYRLSSFQFIYNITIITKIHLNIEHVTIQVRM